jgi:hypothetical protein
MTCETPTKKKGSVNDTQDAKNKSERPMKKNVMQMIKGHKEKR